jgi:allantoin racemase
MVLRVAFVIGQYPPAERKLREDAAKRYETAEIEVGFVSVPLAPFNELLPAEQQQAAPYFHQAFCQAESEGYDAVVPLGMLDLGVEGGRSLVDIPVIGPYQASLHIAALLGERFGIISYTAQSTPKGRILTRNYGMEHFIAGYADCGTWLRTMSDRREQMKESFLSAARSLIERNGADVIIPRGITQCPIHLDPAWLSHELGVPVVEGIGAPIRLAAMFAGLGFRHSRIRWPKSRSIPQMPGMPTM